MKNKEDLLIHNNYFKKAIEEIAEKIEELEMKKVSLVNKIIPPCKHCPLDGVYRCEACKESLFEGFDKKEWF